MNSSLSSFFFFLLLLSKLYSDSNCRCIITGKLTEEQGGNISLKTPSKELFATSSIPRLALKSIRSRWFTPAKDVPVASSCDFTLQDYTGFPSRALPSHTSSASLRELWWSFIPCPGQGGDAHRDVGLVPGARASQTAFPNMPHSHAEQPH